MISTHRVLTIVRKDILWAMANIKLLGVMVLPVFLVVFFSKLDAAATFVFSVTFVNAFVGIFSTSYLIIEEKNRGTLLALLTTPLTPSELLLGKFLFNLVLCLFFSAMAAVMNYRLDVIYNPLVFFNILMFAGTTCFVGYTIGIFFKNEQEMSIFAPFLMFFFIFGDAAEKISDRNNIHAFFPDYHLGEVLKDLTIPISEMLAHSFFSFLLFAVSFAAAVFYTHFYFSNSREKRYSSRLMSLIGLFAVVLLISGFYYNRVGVPEKEKDGLITQRFYTDKMDVEFLYDPEKTLFKSIFESRTKNMFLLSVEKKKEFSLAITTRAIEKGEESEEGRIKKVVEDPKRNLLAHETFEKEGQTFHRWVYTRREKMILLTEGRCGEHLVQWSLDYDLKNMRDLPRALDLYKDLSKSLKFTCL